MSEELGFIPEPSDDDEYESLTETVEVEYKRAKTPQDYKNKANALMSDAMDFLNAKIRSGMAEASDVKTAVEIAKLYRVGIETVDEAAAKAMAEAASYAELDDDGDDAFENSDGMRFEG